ncbi:unnamed protein product, partial [Ascophyllum nodosum]
REETLGPRHPDVASSLNNLAGLLDSQVRAPGASGAESRRASRS